MRKIFLPAIVIALMMFGTCSAEIVTAVGSGNTERHAIHNAIRNAIEQKCGAAVRSKTRVKDFAVVADEIAVDSAGLVSSWEVVSSRVVNGLVVVEIRADIDAEKISARLTDIGKKSLVDFNVGNPRVAVFAVDERGRRCTQVENEIINALKRQGFSRTVERRSDNFRADCLVVAEVKSLPDNEFSISTRLISVGTGEIIFAGTSRSGGMFIGEDDALRLAARRIANELSSAALRDAAQIERHITLFITPRTFDGLGGNLTAVLARIRGLDGVNDVFVRKMISGLELDIDFDGTTTDFAQVLEAFALTILELGANFVRI